MKAGLGSNTITLPNGLQIGAIVVVNCGGNVFDMETGKTIAGTKRGDGKGFYEATELYQRLKDLIPKTLDPNENTTIGIVATNAKLRQKETMKISEMAHDRFARAIRPLHTTGDGDTIFAVAA